MSEATYDETDDDDPDEPPQAAQAASRARPPPRRARRPAPAKNFAEWLSEAPKAAKAEAPSSRAPSAAATPSNGAPASASAAPSTSGPAAAAAAAAAAPPAAASGAAPAPAPTAAARELGEKLAYAAEGGKVQKVKLLLASKANPSSYVTRYTSAIAVGSPDGSDGPAKEEGTATPLHLAANFGHVEVLDALLAVGAQVDAASKPHGHTPLYAAAGSGFSSCVSALLAAKAAPNLSSSSASETMRGNTPLMAACATNAVDCARLLLAARASPNHANARGRTALHLACNYGYAAITALLTEAGASVNRTNNDNNWGALHLACAAKDEKSVALLVAAKATVDLPNFTARDTPLLVACEHGAAACAQLLLGAHANINYQRPSTSDCCGYSALHISCDAPSRLSCVQLLLRSRAEVNASLVPPLDDYDDWDYPGVWAGPPSQAHPPRCQRCQRCPRYRPPAPARARTRPHAPARARTRPHADGTATGRRLAHAPTHTALTGPRAHTHITDWRAASSPVPSPQLGWDRHRCGMRARPTTRRRWSCCWRLARTSHALTAARSAATRATTGVTPRRILSSMQRSCSIRRSASDCCARRAPCR